VCGDDETRETAAYIVHMGNMPSLDRLSDGDLVVQVVRLAHQECRATAELIAALVEFDARKLYLAEGYASLFSYCTGRLHLSEAATYDRIQAARTARVFPMVLERLREGALTLTAVRLLGPHLTQSNCDNVLDAASHQSKGAVEELVARLAARPDVPSSVRKVPERRVATTIAERVARAPAPPAREHPELRPGATLDTHAPFGPVPAGVEPAGRPPVSVPLDGTATKALAPTSATRPAVVRPLAPTRYHVQMTVSAETYAKLRQAQDLLRHRYPTGDPAAILDTALTMLVRHLERQKFAATHGRPRAARIGRAAHSAATAVPGSTGASGPSADCFVSHGGRPTARRDSSRPSRYIPAAVRRAVWTRDGGQCAFIGREGRCTERGFLEFHHCQPFSAGGAATTEGLSLRCRAHNAHEADVLFWPDADAHALAGRQPGSP
jgi:hypothetical protein